MTEDPFDMLFRAKWNVPQAAEAMGLSACKESWEEVKILFAEWCVQQPQVYKSFQKLH